MRWLTVLFIVVLVACGGGQRPPPDLPPLQVLVDVEPGRGKGAETDRRLLARIGPDYIKGSGDHLGDAVGSWGTAPLYTFWSEGGNGRVFCFGFFLIDPGPFHCLDEFPEAVVVVGGGESITEVLLKGPETASLLLVEDQLGQVVGVRPVRGVGYVALPGHFEVVRVRALLDDQLVALPV